MGKVKKNRKDVKATTGNGRIIIGKNGRMEPTSAKASWSPWKIARDGTLDDIEALIAIYNDKKKEAGLSPSEQRALRRDIQILIDAKNILKLKEQENLDGVIEEVDIYSKGRVSYSIESSGYENEYPYYEEDEYGNYRCGSFTGDSEVSQKNTIIYSDEEKDVVQKDNLLQELDGIVDYGEDIEAFFSDEEKKDITSINEEKYRNWNYQLDINVSGNSDDEV